MSSTRSKSEAGKRACKTSRQDANDIARSSRPARPRRTDRVPIETSTGNVYLDLGFPPAEAAFLLLRSRLMGLAGRVIRDRGLTQSEAARLFGVSQPRVSDVVRGRVHRFTIDALVEMLARAGVRLDIVAVA